MSSLHIPLLWPSELELFISSQPNVEVFISISRAKMFPSIENTFAALSHCSPAMSKVLILGLDPYPREESACGIAFQDATVTSWTDTFPPSLRNIMLNLLQHTHNFDCKSPISVLRSFLSEINFASPQSWFNHTCAEGVLWLNTSLTFENKSTYKKHADFWRPIVLFIIETIFYQKLVQLNAESPYNPGLVVVLWGKPAQKFEPIIEECRKKALQKFVDNYGLEVSEAHEKCCQVEFVKANHPCFVPFHKVNSFDLIEKAQDRIGQTRVNWIAIKDSIYKEAYEYSYCDKRYITQNPY
ncbi:hypothetical protein RCL1_001727 [Eukaryota sp. TZLM3-RCL]